jgi:hypothetical protein
MPPPRQYPGLGTPIEASSMFPFDVGPGTRAAGMEMLKREMSGMPSRIPTPMQVLMGMPQLPSAEQQMAEARQRTEQAYYSVPKPEVATSTAEQEGNALQDYGARAPLGGASGVANPVGTDAEMMAMALGGPMRAMLPSLIRGGVNAMFGSPDSSVVAMERERQASQIGQPTLETMAPVPGEKRYNYPTVKVIPPNNPIYPMPAVPNPMDTMRMPTMPFDFR